MFCHSFNDNEILTRLSDGNKVVIHEICIENFLECPVCTAGRDRWLS